MILTTIAQLVLCSARVKIKYVIHNFDSKTVLFGLKQEISL